MCIACMRCHAWHVCMSCRMASSHRRASGHRCGCHHARVHASHGHEGEEQEGKKHGVTLFTWILSLRQALSPQKGPFWGPQEGGAIIPPFRGVLGAPFGGSPGAVQNPFSGTPPPLPSLPGDPGRAPLPGGPKIGPHRDFFNKCPKMAFLADFRRNPRKRPFFEDPDYFFHGRARPVDLPRGE